MKHFTDVVLKKELKALDKIIFTDKGIRLAEHALNMGPKINRMKYLYGLHEKIAVAQEHLKSNEDITANSSLEEIIKFSLMSYDNRTIEIKTGSMNSYEKMIKNIENKKGMDFVVNYKYWFFEPLDMLMWEKHMPKHGERLLFYASDYKNIKKNPQKAHENQREAINEATMEIGAYVADKPKKYMKWAHRTYKINAKEGMHARPSSQIITIANKYKGDVWLRTESSEFIGKSIMMLLTQGITSDKELTILYKPKEEAEEFYKEMENISDGKEENYLLTRVR
jgi:phosphocarrier protein HPr